MRIVTRVTSDFCKHVFRVPRATTRIFTRHTANNTGRSDLDLLRWGFLLVRAIVVGQARNRLMNAAFCATRRECLVLFGFRRGSGCATLRLHRALSTRLTRPFFRFCRVCLITLNTRMISRLSSTARVGTVYWCSISVKCSSTGWVGNLGENISNVALIFLCTNWASIRRAVIRTCFADERVTRILRRLNCLLLFRNDRQFRLLLHVGIVKARLSGGISLWGVRHMFVWGLGG